MIKFYSKAILFLTLLMGLLWSVDSFFLRHTNEKVASVQSIYDDGNYDILFFGDSHISNAIQPQIIDAKLNANSTVIFGGELNIVEVYYNIMESLAYHSPQLIVVETFPLRSIAYSNNTIFENGVLQVGKWENYNNKNLGVAKLKEINAIHKDNKWYQMLNVFRYHKRWVDLPNWSKDVSAKLVNTAKKNYMNTARYSSPLSVSKYEQYQKAKFYYGRICLSEQEEVYIQKIIELTQEKNIDLLFITVPVLDEYYRKVKPGYEIVDWQLDNILKSYPAIKHWNYNAELGGYGRTKILNEKRVSTNQHLNYGGAVEFSNDMTSYIKSNFNSKYDGSSDNVTVEKILYSNKRINKNENMYGEVSDLNGIPIKKYETFPELKLHKDKKTLILKGWIYMDGIDNYTAKKRIALKKDGKLVYLMKHEVRSLKSPFLKDRFEINSGNCGYELMVNSKLFDPGKYQIYHVLETKEGKVFVQDMEKWIVKE